MRRSLNLRRDRSQRPPTFLAKRTRSTRADSCSTPPQHTQSHLKTCGTRCPRANRSHTRRLSLSSPGRRKPHDLRRHASSRKITRRQLQRQRLRLKYPSSRLRHHQSLIVVKINGHDPSLQECGEMILHRSRPKLQRNPGKPFHKAALMHGIVFQELTITYDQSWRHRQSEARYRSYSKLLAQPI